MVGLLVDTHVLIWWGERSPKLPAGVSATIEHAERVWVSIASLWEIAVKTGLGKLEVSLDAVIRGLPADGISVLPITEQHCLEVARLARHHRDPFDRMIVAQALTERLTLVTRDKRLADYTADLILCP